MGLINNTSKEIKDIPRTNIPDPKKIYQEDLDVQIEEAKKKDKKEAKKKVVTTSSIRVDKLTQLKLSALVNLGEGDTVNALINVLVDEYIYTKLSKKDRDNYEMLLAVFKSKAGMK